MTDDGIRAIRNFVIATVLRVAVLAIALLALAGYFIPRLINAHNDAYLWLAILLAIATPIVMAVVGVQLVLDCRRFPTKFHKAEGGSK
ncbi:MAG: hypothetical protein ACHP7N_04300 [Caulobacterales bacterium]